jgi:hypothetical protein
MPKISYETQRTTPCNINAQKWYFFNAMKKSKVGSTPAIRSYYKGIANYYLNGNINLIKQNNI